MSYAECTPATPHPPGAYYGGPGSAANAAVVSADPGTQITQITDEAGHTFFRPDGSVNEDPATRIPFSAPVYPLVAPVLLPRVQPAARPRLGAAAVQLPAVQLPAIQLPAGQPSLFVFSQAAGKSLTFQFGGAAPAKSLQFYANGITLALQANGGGTLRAFDILRPTRGFEIEN